jgi:DNA-binding transcriptional MerR regulator
VGLLAEPERSANGYKRYGVAHLLRLLHIKRLTELGFSLGQIASMEDNDADPRQALIALDAELAATIERLQRARAELAEILQHSAPTDLSPELASVVDGAALTDADRAFVVVMTRVMTPAALDTYKEMLRRPGTSSAGAEFDALSEDADESTREALARRLIPEVEQLYAEYPGLREAGESPNAAGVMAVALAELYNAAQLDVLKRIGRAFPRH